MIATGRDGAVAVVTIDRHSTRNSLDAEVCTALREAIESAGALADAEDPVRAIVVTGAGTAFCAGADLSGGVYNSDFYEAHAGMLRAVESVPVPVVAAVNGPAVGAGVQLALAADLRVVAPGAVFAVPVVKVGLALDNWTIKRLANVVGGGHARSVLMTARPVGAEEAARIGLANEIGGLDAAMELAAQISEFAPLSLRHIKSVINDDDARLLPRDEHTELQQRAWTSEDMAEARAARAEKRPPVFRGR
jgi:enoyl-CoA hydratase